MNKPAIGPELIASVKEIVMVVRHIVNHPEAVEVNVRPGPYRMTVELYTHPMDVGQVVGRNGHLSSSLRSLLTAFAGKHKIKVDFDYVTEEENARVAAAGNGR